MGVAVVFLVEDDRKIRTELTKLLEKYGYRCDSSDDFANITKIILERKPQLVLLDLNLPACDGFCVCRELRRYSHIPIIVVTSRDSDTDELMSMNLGADDFVTKPYNTQILLARIAAVLNRAYPQEAPDSVRCRDLEVSFTESTVRGPDGTADLTKNELKILGLLLSVHGRIATRDEIMNALWQSDEFVDDNTLTVNINRLRRKLESIGVRDYLVTKRGQGYRICT